MALDNFLPPAAKDESDRKLLDDIATYGWHIVQVSKDTDGPGYAFTVGLFLTYGHPELLVMGLKEEVSHRLFWTAVKHIATGKTFDKEETTNSLIEGHSCQIWSIPPNRYQEYLGYGIWFYCSLSKPFPALQIVWPDKDGKFPNEQQYDTRFLSLQHVLKERV